MFLSTCSLQYNVGTVTYVYAGTGTYFYSGTTTTLEQVHMFTLEHLQYYSAGTGTSAVEGYEPSY